MTHQAPLPPVPAASDAGRQVAQLRSALMLVDQIAGRSTSAPDEDAALDESARISSAYEQAAPVTQRRFDALVAETALWATAGVEALLAAHRDGVRPHGPAVRLAEDLTRALRLLARVLSL